MRMVLATEEAKDVHILTSSEGGESVPIPACCNAETKFISLFVILKGRRQKVEFTGELPRGLEVFMDPKSS